MSLVKILVVDDDESIVEFLTMILEGAGYAVLTASEGRGAVNIAEADGLSAVLLDYMMPDIDGLELAAKLKNIKPGMPMFIVTAYDNPELRKRAAGAGICEVIGKPFEPEVLLEMIDRVLDRKKT